MSTALDSPHQEPIPEEQLGRPNLSTQQGDKIGRILAQWVSVCFGKLHENNILGYFFQRLRLCINTCRNGLGFILGEFVTNSSGHPAIEQQLRARN
jgi:hypothetical protein